MPGPPPTEFHSDTTLPDRVDVAIIGGGIIGCATALELAERGFSVALFEKGVIAGEQSGRNWGWVRIAMRDPRELPLMMEAMRGWESYAERLAHPTGFHRCGILFSYQNEQAGARYADWLRNLEPYQTPARILERHALRELLGDVQLDADGALYTPEDARAEPQLAAPAIAEGARAQGARLFTGCAVRVVEHSAGRVSAVVTERGRVACDQVVLAAGAWSRLFAGNLGIDIPQLKVLNSVLRTSPVRGGPETSLWAKGLAWRKRRDGGYTLADGGSNLHGITPDSFRLLRRFLPSWRANAGDVTPRLDDRFLTELRTPRHWSGREQTVFEQDRALDPSPAAARMRKVWAKAQAAIPALERAQIVQSWGGLIDVTPDAIPVIGPVDSHDGLFVATGFSGHGFGIGPGAGRLMADLVTGRAPVVDPTPFRLSRFSDGSPLLLDDAF
ncbi:NAD(P)/FAD-dependent oxidoreductase [Primorskyibacter sp. S187A]|uniref:NAD(P)/FAD-dependent oxidoreductase n=1 Tax=Primorskyibacter sp. S187A TaxID=3415130 RepID=UPI003C7CF34C